MVQPAKTAGTLSCRRHRKEVTGTCEAVTGVHFVLCASFGLPVLANAAHCARIARPKRSWSAQFTPASMGAFSQADLSPKRKLRSMQWQLPRPVSGPSQSKE